MAGSTRKLKQSHKEGTISQGHYALKSPLGFLHLFSFTTKINVSPLLPTGVKKLLNLIHSNLSYHKTRSELLNSDVTRGQEKELSPQLYSPQPVWNSADTRAPSCPTAGRTFTAVSKSPQSSPEMRHSKPQRKGAKWHLSDVDSRQRNSTHLENPCFPPLKENIKVFKNIVT